MVGKYIWNESFWPNMIKLCNFSQFCFLALDSSFWGKLHLLCKMRTISLNQNLWRGLGRVISKIQKSKISSRKGRRHSHWHNRLPVNTQDCEEKKGKYFLLQNLYIYLDSDTISTCQIERNDLNRARWTLWSTLHIIDTIAAVIFTRYVQTSMKTKSSKANSDLM